MKKDNYDNSNVHEFLDFQDEGADGWSYGPRYFPLTKEEYNKITNYKTVDPDITEVSIKENGMVSVRPQGFDAISGADILVDVAGGGGGAYIDDDHASTATTYSSSKVEELLKNKSNTGHTHTAAEVGALPSSTTIPSKTSELTNDSGFAAINDNSASNSTTYSSSKLEEIFGKVVILTQEEYDSLEVKDEQTFYIISDAS